MTLPNLTFQFHDIASVEVSTDSPVARAFFEAEYNYHNLKIPTFQTLQSTLDCKDLPHVFLDYHQNFVAPKGYTRHSHKILARWNYNLKIKPGSIDIRVNGSQIAIPLVHHMLLHPSLRWLSCIKGTLLLHAGAVAKNNKSLLFTGKGGTGKTTTTSLILAAGQGWQIHADDYVFTNGFESKAYITRSHLYRDLKKWVPDVKTRLTVWEQIRLEFLGALRKYTRDGIKWPVRVNPQHLWPNITIANSATPAAILLLERSDVPRPALLPLNCLEETINDLLNMNFGEAGHFLTLLKKAGELDNNWLNGWKESERELITILLSKNASYRLVLPLSNSSYDIQSTLMPILNELVE